MVNAMAKEKCFPVMMNVLSEFIKWLPERPFSGSKCTATQQRDRSVRAQERLGW
jgi:hypothetical protein